MVQMSASAKHFHPNEDLKSQDNVCGLVLFHEKLQISRFIERVVLLSTEIINLEIKITH